MRMFTLIAAFFIGMATPAMAQSYSTNSVAADAASLFEKPGADNIVGAYFNQLAAKYRSLGERTPEYRQRLRKYRDLSRYEQVAAVHLWVNSILPQDEFGPTFHALPGDMWKTSKGICADLAFMKALALHDLGIPWSDMRFVSTSEMFSIGHMFLLVRVEGESSPLLLDQTGALEGHAVPVAGTVRGQSSYDPNGVYAISPQQLAAN